MGGWIGFGMAQYAIERVNSFVIGLDDYKRMKVRRVACVSCPVGCTDIVRIPEGPYSGLEKHTSSAINLLT